MQYVSSKFKVNTNDPVLLYFVYSFFIPRPLLMKMLGDNLKIFVHGLPLDCEEHSLKDFLEGKVYAKLGGT